MGASTLAGLAGEMYSDGVDFRKYPSEPSTDDESEQSRTRRRRERETTSGSYSEEVEGTGSNEDGGDEDARRDRAAWPLSQEEQREVERALTAAGMWSRGT